MNNNEKYKYVLGMIKDSWHECADRKVGFSLEEFTEAALSKQNFYSKLKRAMNEGFIELIDIPDEDDYVDDPESFPGIFVATISPKFDALFKKAVNNNSQQNEGINPIVHDQGLQWGDITIMFIDGHNVEIAFNDDWGRKINKNYVDFGCKDNKTTLPKLQWEFLRELANYNGIISPRSNNCKIKDIKRRKQELSKTLIRVFEIYNSKPFEKCKKGGDYEIKIKLIPDGRNKGKLLYFDKKLRENSVDAEANEIFKSLGGCYDKYGVDNKYDNEE